MRFLNFEKVQWVWRGLYYENMPRRRASCPEISMQRLSLSDCFESQPIRKRFCQKRQSYKFAWQILPPMKTIKKCLGVFKLDYVIILVIITAPFAIGMTFAQFLDLLFKIGIFLRKESVEVRDLQITWSVHRPFMDYQKADPRKVHFVN